MREGKLYSLCNENNNVFEVVADIYCSLFLYFINTYISEGHNITKMDELNKALEKKCKANLKLVLKEFY